MSSRLRLYMLLCIACLPATLRADGGVVRARETSGPYVVTIFSPADLSLAAPADLSVLVQDRTTQEVVLGAQVTFTFTAPSGAELATGGGWCGPMNATFLAGSNALAQSPAIPATHARATNQLLYAAHVILPAQGQWHVQTHIRRGSDLASVGCELPVNAPPQRLAVVWPALALPLIAIGLFGVHQRLRAGRGLRVPHS